MRCTSTTVWRSVISSILLVLAANSTFAAETRTWKTADGKFSVEAELVEATATEVTLRRSDNGKVVKVPLSKLSNSDRDWLAKAKSSEPTTDESTSSHSPASNGALKKVDADHVSFDPYGPVLIPSPDIEWKLVPGDIPAIVAVRGKPLLKESKESLPDRIFVCVHPPVDVGERERFTEQLIKSAVADLVSIGYTEGTVKSRKPNQIKEFPDQYFYTLTTAAARTEASTYGRVHFQANRTIVVQTRLASPVREDRYSSAADLTESVFTQIAQDTSWNPPQEIPADVKEDIITLKEQSLKLLDEKKYVAVIENLFPEKALEEIKASGATIDKFAEEFSRRDATELRKELEDLNWDIAIYDATNKRLTFRGTKLGFEKVDGQWRLMF